MKKFWKSIWENTLQASKIGDELELGIEKLKAIYPKLKPTKIYFTLRAFCTKAAIIDSLVLLGSKISMVDSATKTSEFREN